MELQLSKDFVERAAAAIAAEMLGRLGADGRTMPDSLMEESRRLCRLSWAWASLLSHEREAGLEMMREVIEKKGW